ncbi:MAG: hypothetical protein ACI4PQ_07785 [Butyricicoccaceae bacterium]
MSWESGKSRKADSCAVRLSGSKNEKKEIYQTVMKQELVVCSVRPDADVEKYLRMEQ